MMLNTVSAMHPYRKYAVNPVSERNLRRLGYDPNEFAHQVDGNSDAVKALRAVGYRKAQAVDIEEEVKGLFEEFGGQVIFGECRLAPCSVWRAERVQIGDESLSRFAVRLHVFQSAGPSHAEDVNVAVPGQPTYHGRFIGYISLRPTSASPNQRFGYITIANIAPPRYMMRPEFHVISCVSGGHDSEMPVRCTPYVVPNFKTKDFASCLHGALQEALLLKTNQFGFVPISSLEMITLLWELKDGSIPISEISSEFTSLEDALCILESDEVRAGGVIETFRIGDSNGSSDSERKTATQNRALAVMADYLSTGIPVILALQEDTDTTTGSVGRDVKHSKVKRPGAEGRKEKKRVGHCVLVFGLYSPNSSGPCLGSRNENDDTQSSPPKQWRGLPSHLIAHDNLTGPYLMRTAEEYLEKAWTEHDAADGRQAGISFLPILPRKTNLGIGEVRNNAKFFADQLVGQVWPDDIKNGRDYVDIPGTESEIYDLQARLIRSDQVALEFQTGLACGDLLALKDGLTSNSQPYWWLVDVLPRHLVSRGPRLSREHAFLAFVWPLVDAGDPSADAPADYFEAIANRKRPYMIVSRTKDLCEVVFLRSESSIEPT